MSGRNPLTDPWVWKMAWRDSRSSRSRLALFMSSIVLGISALVAISSFSDNLTRAIDEQARNLLGADLSLRSRTPFTEQDQALLGELGGRRALQTSFSSMAYFPESADFRLVQVRAIEGGFPFYGSVRTDPSAAARTYQQGPEALVDDALMRQFSVQVGDPLRLGEFTFTIAGRLLDIPGESVAFSVAAPRVFIPLDYLEETGLVQVGSRVSYRSFFEFAPGTDVESMVEAREAEFRERGWRWDTVAGRKRSLGRAMENLTRFLNLTGFIALLLGALGIASSIHLYVKQKRPTVAVLRCLGARGRQVLGVYVLQAVAMGLLGALAGSLLGIGVQVLLPEVLSDFLPVSIPFAISWLAVGQGTVVGLGFALLFALLPLAPVRSVSPLVALRAEFEETRRRWDPFQLLLALLIAVGVLAFAIWQTDRWYYGLFFFLGLAAALGLLVGVAKVIMLAVRRSFPSSWSYVWRQGLANLYRPQNQTLVLMLSLGLGTFLIVTLFLVQTTLLSQAALSAEGDRPNLVFFDIQSDQKAEVREALETAGAPLLQDVPIVTMRLSSLKGRSVAELRADENRTQPMWLLAREYRSTYREELIETETITQGRWVGRVAEGDAGPVPISLEEGVARELEVGIGDSLVFDVQGVPVKTVLASTRLVEWERVQPNFFAVFPEGVLEDAPQFHVLVTRAESSEESADLQRAVLERFPNVSSVDLGLILRTVDTILDKVAFVIRFMALFSFFTGLTVLAGAVITSRYQRMRETVLLRTLGAARRQVLQIMVIEYVLLGTLASLTGLILSLGAGWALAFFLFEIPFPPLPLSIVGAVLLVVALTLLIGWLNSRSLLDRPPLEVLRSEAAA